MVNQGFMSLSTYYYGVYMAATLHNSVAVAVVMLMHTQAILLAMITIKKSTHRFPFLPYI